MIICIKSFTFFFRKIFIKFIYNLLFSYPQPGRVLVAPKSLEGEAQSLVFTAIHRDRNAVLYWHIDDDYIGATTLEHKISVRPAPGAHRLTVIDEHGARQSVAFSCR